MKNLHKKILKLNSKKPNQSHLLPAYIHKYRQILLKTKDQLLINTIFERLMTIFFQNNILAKKSVYKTLKKAIGNSLLDRRRVNKLSHVDPLLYKTEILNNILSLDRSVKKMVLKMFFLFIDSFVLDYEILCEVIFKAGSKFCRRCSENCLKFRNVYEHHLESLNNCNNMENKATEVQNINRETNNDCELEIKENCNYVKFKKAEYGMKTKNHGDESLTKEASNYEILIDLQKKKGEIENLLYEIYKIKEKELNNDNINVSCNKENSNIELFNSKKHKKIDKKNIDCSLIKENAAIDEYNLVDEKTKLIPENIILKINNKTNENILESDDISLIIEYLKTHDNSNSVRLLAKYPNFYKYKLDTKCNEKGFLSFKEAESLFYNFKIFNKDWIKLKKNNYLQLNGTNTSIVINKGDEIIFNECFDSNKDKKTNNYIEDVYRIYRWDDVKEGGNYMIKYKFLKFFLKRNNREIAIFILGELKNLKNLRFDIKIMFDYLHSLFVDSEEQNRLKFLVKLYGIDKRTDFRRYKRLIYKCKKQRD